MLSLGTQAGLQLLGAHSAPAPFELEGGGLQYPLHQVPALAALRLCGGQPRREQWFQ